MERTILFQKNADVLTADGKRIGSLERVVLDPETKVITDIVVSTGTLFHKENKVVPVGLISDTTESQIILSDEAGELESYPPLEERRIVSENPDQPGPSGSIPPAVYGAPGMGPAMAPGPKEPFVTRIEQNIPEGTIALKEGAKVVTADEEHVGNVERIVTDTSTDQVTHLLISRGLLKHDRKLIPIHWVERLAEDVVHLQVSKNEVEELEAVPIA